MSQQKNTQISKNLKLEKKMGWNKIFENLSV